MPADGPTCHRRAAAIEALRKADLLTTVQRGAGPAGSPSSIRSGVLVLWVELAGQRPFTPRDQTLLAVLAGRLGQGLQRVTSWTSSGKRRWHFSTRCSARRSAGRLRGALPPASRPLEVGGDWYDVVDLDDGRIALIVGDCVGHGLAAATVMGSCAVRAARCFEHPRRRRARRAGPVRRPTARRGVHHRVLRGARPGRGELELLQRGAPTRVLVRGRRPRRTLEGGTAPLGLPPPRYRPTPGRPSRKAALLLYTDGLVERRHQSLDHGIAAAAKLLTEHRALPAREVADRIMTGMAPVVPLRLQQLVQVVQRLELLVDRAVPVGEVEAGGEALVDAGEVPVAEELGDVGQLVAEAGQVDADLAQLPLDPAALPARRARGRRRRGRPARRRRRACGRRPPARPAARWPAP